MTDFSTPRRMSAGAFVVLFIKSLKEFVGAGFIAIGYLVLRPDDSNSPVLFRAVIALLTFIALSLVTAFVRYYFRRFHIEGDKLIFTHGFAAKRTTSIPLSRVHTLRTNRGLFYRIFDLRGVAFDTLASDKQEVELILDESDWRKLLYLVKSGENIVRNTDPTVPPPFVTEGVTQKISNYNIIKGAICQNHLKGFAILGAVILAVFDKINQFDDDTTGRIIDYIDNYSGDVLPTVGQALSFFAVIYFIIMMLWTGKLALRYGNMTLTTDGKRLTIESGFISRFTCRLTRDKVTILSIKRNPLETLADCQTVTLRQASNATGSKKEDGIRIYGSMLGGQLLAWWLGSDSVDHALLTAKSGKGLMVRKFLPNLILALAAVMLISHFTHNWPAAVIIGSVYIAVSVIRSLLAWKHSSITLTDSYIAINSGNIAHIYGYIKYRDIESVGIRSTPFTAYTNRVSLRVATNAGAVTIYSLRNTDALRLRNMILNKTVCDKL